MLAGLLDMRLVREGWAMANPIPYFFVSEIGIAELFLKR